MSCEYGDLCGLPASSGAFCLLHAPNPDKSKDEFTQLLREHGKKTTNYGFIAFPAGCSSFLNVEFAGQVFFYGCVFYGEADFSGSSFKALPTMLSSVSFFRTRFMGGAHFRFSVFNGAAIFNEAEINGDLDLISTRCHGLADFQDLNVHGFGSFNDAVFLDRASFSRAKFAGPVSFAAARFEHGVEFSHATMLSPVTFEGAIFGGVSYFNAKKYGELFASDVSFERALVLSSGRVEFAGANLSRARFLTSDLRDAVFVGVKWPTLRGRSAVYEELLMQASGDFDWHGLEDLYRHLRKNYEDRRDYERGGDFHVGEKDARLRSRSTPSFLRIILAFYNLTSRYGESPKRAAGWILALMLISTTVFLVSGLRMSSGKDAVDAVDLSPTIFSDWGWALLFSVRTMFHLKTDSFVTYAGVARAVETFVAVLGPVSAALFALALRQRLKR